MHEPDASSPAFGTPIAALRGEPREFLQIRTEIADGLTMLSGINWGAAQVVADATGDLIRYPFHVLGFLDLDGRALAVVIHCGAGLVTEPELSISSEGLPLSRPVLRALAYRFFVEIRLASVMIRVRSDDERMQATLLRLGFTASGRDDAPEPHARLLFTIDAATALRRAYPRGLAPGKVQ